MNIDYGLEKKYREEILELADELEYEIIPRFEDILGYDEPGVEDFDSALADLYDWGDTKFDYNLNGATLCWINTLF